MPWSCWQGFGFVGFCCGDWRGPQGQVLVRVVAISRDLGAVLQYAENLENFKKGATKHNQARPIQRQVSSQALCYAQLQLDCTEGNLARNSCIRRDPTLEKFPSGSRFHRPRNLNATALKVVVPGLRQGACRSLRRLHEILSRWERCRTWFWDVLGVPNLSADPSTLNL